MIGPAKISRRILWSGALILLLLLLALKAAMEGVSNFYAQSAYMEIGRWSRPGFVPAGDEGPRVTGYLNQSLDYSPGNPWPLEQLGTLQLSGIGALRDAQLAMAAAQNASAGLRKALVARPTSPFAWANFALSKLALGEYDEALFQAIERAEELGPWEPEAQQAVIFAGLTVWTRLAPAQQAAVVRAMQRGAQRNPAKIAQLAASFSRIDLFCALSYSGTQGREICSQTSKPGSKPNRKQ